VHYKDKEGPALANWVKNQRKRYASGRMDQGRKVKLDEIGFKFSPRRDKANQEKWNLKFKKLQDYYEKHGHCELFWAVDRFASS
jgi:hypothetical protein